MHCYNCGKEINDKAVVCVNCGVAAINPHKQKRKLSNLQIAAIILFSIQAIGLIVLGAFYIYIIAYSLGIMLFSIIGFILLFLDFRNKTSKNNMSSQKKRTINFCAGCGQELEYEADCPRCGRDATDCPRRTVN